MAVQQTVPLHEALVSLRDRLERGDIDGARAMVARLTGEHPDSEDIRYYARMLARPQVISRPGEPSRRLDQERAWLRAHAREYPGCWLAVSGDTLVAAGPDYAAVLATVRRTVGVDNAVLYFQP
jgi:hypothetical protein